MRRAAALFTVLLALSLAHAADLDLRHLTYPETAREGVVDDYHGTKVADPYRWLEEEARNSERVRAWVGAQNKLTFAYLEAIPEREQIRKRLTELWNYEKYKSPKKAGGKYYFFRNDGLQNQDVLYAADSLDGKRRPVMNPNEWSEDGSVALRSHEFSDDGRYLAYSRSVAGSDWREWRVFDLEAGKDLPDRIRWTKWTSAAWTRDGKGFFYSRFPQVEKGQEYQALNKNNKVYYHRAGTSQEEDRLVYERPDHPEWGFQVETSEDGRYLILEVSKGTDDVNRVLYVDLEDESAGPVELIGHFDDEYDFLGNDGPVFWFKTTFEAPSGRVIAIDTRKPEPSHWREVIPEAPQALRSVEIVGGMFSASYLKDAITWIRIFRLDGTHLRDVDLPGIGTATGFHGKRKDGETFYSFSSINRPGTVYRYDMKTGESTLWQQPEVVFDPEAYEVKQLFYPSKDGTRVPMFIAHRKGLKLNGKQPTLLYGYGGFNIPLRPRFYVSRLAWMEMGGIFAMANLRGGGEYGEAWHKAGTKLQKQNVFDDFIAAAEWLIRNKYTRPSKLAIQGGSNGGLLVGAVMNQRPDLFGAALPAVGVMDMLRFHRFTAGRYWVDDYGSAEDPEEFKAIYAYSPYHNLKKGEKYPATLVTTADTDDRVVPGHSFKYAAQLQYADRGNRPQLIRIQTAAGHGAGKPTRMKIEETADLWTFLVKNLEMKLD